MSLEVVEWDIANDSSRIEHALGPYGCGAVSLRHALDEDFRSSLIEEIADDTKVIWQDAGDKYRNKRGVEVEQNHDVFALKLSQGPQSQVSMLPKMKMLADGVQNLIRNMSDLYPTLSSWQADEMSYHRYYEEKTGLSFHRDNLRFVGLIAVASIQGECDFQVIDRLEKKIQTNDKTGEREVLEWDWRSTYTIPTSPGDIVLTRAPGLYPDIDDDADRPEHAVMNVRKGCSAKMS